MTLTQEEADKLVAEIPQSKCCDLCNAEFTGDLKPIKRPHGPFPVWLCIMCAELWDRTQAKKGKAHE